LTAAFTVGHSTHPPADFAALLARHGIRGIADVRRYPGSRRVPHFGADDMRRWMAEAGVAYAHLPSLGGRRSRVPDSPNGGWRVAAFQGYADWMATPDFASGLRELEALCDARRTAAMCAEAPWWRCHRRLVADALVARGRPVLHVLPDGGLAEHVLPDFAVVAGGALTYPPPGTLPV
jgi:uncharacterized protein (DUF488 family)